MSNYIVYRYTSPSNKSYIGLTNNPKRRAIIHNTRTHCPAFHSALQEYGITNFKYEVLANNLSLADAHQLERAYIQEFDTLVPNGYNVLKGHTMYEVRTDTQATGDLQAAIQNMAEKAINDIYQESLKYL